MYTFACATLNQQCSSYGARVSGGVVMDADEVTSAEVFDRTARLEKELSSLRMELHLAVAAIDSLTAKLASDAAGRRRMAARTICPNCGSHVDHHLAEAGDLQICPICGWSEFIGNKGERCTGIAASSDVGGGAAPSAWV